jgi:Zn ribbon nucleic-acid-binding protein
MRTNLICPRCSNPRFHGWVVSDFELTHCVMCGFVLEDKTGPGYQGQDYHYRIIDSWKNKTLHLESAGRHNR